ncbi:MAG: hypothetical protein ACI4TA_10265 [Acetatifactor sp.]|nr:hypothetical protein [Lachnospiraceae bacterium]
MKITIKLIGIRKEGIIYFLGTIMCVLLWIVSALLGQLEKNLFYFILSSLSILVASGYPAILSFYDMKYVEEEIEELKKELTLDENVDSIMNFNSELDVKLSQNKEN